MALTDTRLRNIKATGKRQKISDRDGLYAIVNPGGSISWWVRFREDGKDRSLSIGSYPEIGLARAREINLEIRTAKLEGRNPEHIVRPPSNNDTTFEALARAWHATKIDKICAKHSRRILQRLEANLFPVIGTIQIGELKPYDVLNAIKPVENRNSLEVAQRLAAYCNSIADYAVILGHLQYNQFSGLTKVVRKPEVKHRATIVDPEKVGDLLDAVDGYRGSFAVHMAAKIMPYTFVRSIELRGATWNEIDYDTATWTIPAERMKMKRPHIVPMSRQVMELFKQLRDGHAADICFPSPTSRTRCISDVGLLNVFRRLGYDKTDFCVHGFRAMASTLLNEMGYRPDVIEAQLAHAESNKVRAAYNHAQYLDERRSMMQEWADYLDSLRSRSN